MPIAARCPHCLAELSARDDLAGRPVRCTNCRGLLTLPGEAAPRERPRRPAKAQGGGKVPLALLIVGGVGLLLGCAVCGGVGAWLFYPDGPAPVADAGTPGTGTSELRPADEQSRPMEPAALTPKRPKLGEPVATVTSVELSGEFLKAPAAAATKYAGKVVRVRGSVVGRAGDDTLVLEGEFDAKGGGRRLVNCQLHPADHAALADVKARATVTVVGKCTGLTTATRAVALTDCLLDP